MYAGMFEKILIATRGEIACRIARTCQRLGIAAATVHATLDRDALHVATIGESVEVGGDGKSSGYLNIEAILAAAQLTGAQAIHPGIGFLAENAAFAESVERAGLVFIGPRAETLLRFGDKISAKAEAEAAGLSVLAGAPERYADVAELEEAIGRMQLPVLIKAAFGGGGRGVRVIQRREGLAGAIASAMREADNAFGRPDLMVERFMEGARHVEVQIAGDGTGNVLHFFERECSLQRRFQKLVEESPAPNLPVGLAERLRADACRLAAHARFRNLGTIEFLVSAQHHYFLECNPRLQVEHTVTEMVTGRDLVELQLRIAAEGRLPLHQEDVASAGHAIQARVYAEDPSAEFAPSTGLVVLAEFPAEKVRVDAGIEQGSEIGPHYDPLVAKLIANGPERRSVLRKLGRAVAETAVLGVATNLSFLETLLSHPAVVAGEVDTLFIERERLALSERMRVGRNVLAVAAYVCVAAHRSSGDKDPWSRLERFTGWRLSDGSDESPWAPAFLLQAGGKSHEVSVGSIVAGGQIEFRIDGEPVRLRVSDLNGDKFRVSLGSDVMVVRAVRRGDTIFLHGPFGCHAVSVESFLGRGDEQSGASGYLLSPMMGRIVKLNVRVGDAVKAEDVLVLQESMKMEFAVRAPWDGIVTEVACNEEEMVERHSHIITIEPLDPMNKG
jgi:3-methylcrotonyl-CoA carboxylase alpha subunit